jgi:hypothetical protein
MSASSLVSGHTQASPGAHIEILGLDEGRVCNDGHADNVLESEVEDKAG